MRPKSLDHVALWTAARDDIAEALVSELGIRVVERTDRFTLLGPDARRGKLTLFDADGPREAGPLVHVALRARGGGPELDLPDGLRVVVVDAETDVDLDLDHVLLRSPEPERAATEYERYGFRRVGPRRLEVGGAFVELTGDGNGAAQERPLLNHIGLLVDSMEEHRAAAEAAGIEIADVVDAPNTLALFVWGPDGVKIEYVEHKPSFSLT